MCSSKLRFKKEVNMEWLWIVFFLWLMDIIDGSTALIVVVIVLLLQEPALVPT